MVTYAGLVAMEIAYATLVDVERLKVSSVSAGISVALMDVVVLTCWLAVAAVVTYMYSCSWELELRSPVAVYAALGDSFTSLVLDWYATLSLLFSLLDFFLRHTNTMIMMTAAVMITNSIPATPTPTKNDASFTIAPVLCEVGVVEAAIVVTDTGGVVTGSEGRDVGFELKREKSYSVSQLH